MRTWRAWVLAAAACAAAAGGCQSPQDEARVEMERELTMRDENRQRSVKLYEEGSALAAGRPADAAQKLREAVRIDDRNAEAWMALGTVEFGRRRLAEAAEAFHRAARLLPARYEPRFNLGTVLEAGGQHGRAIVEYEAALERSSDQVEVMENLARCYIRTNQRPERAAELVERAITIEHRPQWVRWLGQQQLRLMSQRQRRMETPSAPPTAAPTPPIDGATDIQTGP